MSRKYRLGFLLGILLSLTAGHILYGNWLAVPGLEPFLSLNEVAYNALWILTGLAAVFTIMIGWTFLKSIHRPAGEDLNEPELTQIEFEPASFPEEESGSEIVITY